MLYRSLVQTSSSSAWQEKKITLASCISCSETVRTSLPVRHLCACQAERVDPQAFYDTGLVQSCNHGMIWFISLCLKSHLWLLPYTWDVYLLNVLACSVCLKGRQLKEELDPTAQHGTGYMDGCLASHVITFIYLYALNQICGDSE